MGFLAKFYAEDIEHINKGPIDALKSSGATKVKLFHLVSSLKSYLLLLQTIYIF